MFAQRTFFLFPPFQVTKGFVSSFLRDNQFHKRPSTPPLLASSVLPPQLLSRRRFSLPRLRLPRATSIHAILVKRSPDLIDVGSCHLNSHGNGICLCCIQSHRFGPRSPRLLLIIATVDEKQAIVFDGLLIGDEELVSRDGRAGIFGLGSVGVEEGG